jgi:hypothetical protein
MNHTAIFKIAKFDTENRFNEERNQESGAREEEGRCEEKEVMAASAEGANLKRKGLR